MKNPFVTNISNKKIIREYVDDADGRPLFLKFIGYCFADTLCTAGNNDNLPKEKQSELIGRKFDFAKKAGITP